MEVVECECEFLLIESLTARHNEIYFQFQKFFSFGAAGDIGGVKNVLLRCLSVENRKPIEMEAQTQCCMND